MVRTILGFDELFCDYVFKVTRCESDVSHRLCEEAAVMPEVQMQIAPGQGRFMALRVEQIGA